MCSAVCKDYKGDMRSKDKTDAECSLRVLECLQGCLERVYDNQSYIVLNDPKMVLHFGRVHAN